MSQAPECVLLLTTLGPQRQQQGQQGHKFGSPGSKFKVMGILVSGGRGRITSNRHWLMYCRDGDVGVSRLSYWRLAQ